MRYIAWHPHHWSNREAGGSWRVRIWHNGKRVYVGCFRTLFDAKVARDAWLVSHKRQVRFVRRAGAS